jgi:hypothetical protein
MAEIYRSASKVIIWLGEPEFDETRNELVDGLEPCYEPSVDWTSAHKEELPDNLIEYSDGTLDYATVSAFLLIGLLAMDCHVTDFPYFPESHFSTIPDDQTLMRDRALLALPGRTGGSMDLDQYPAWRRAAGALLLMMTRSYWTRVWTVQEAILGTHSLVYYGRHVIWLEALIGAEKNLRVHYYGCCSAWGAEARGSRWSKMTSILEELFVVKGLGDLRNKIQCGESPALFDLMNYFREVREATDPRDNVYGFFGVVSERESEKLIPDYSLTTAEVYAQATIKMINGRGDLLPLVHAERPRRESLHLLSWAPDWGASVEGSPEPYDWCLFRASRDQQVVAERVKGSTLILRGVLIDRVSEVGKRMVWEHLQTVRLLVRMSEWKVMVDTTPTVCSRYSKNDGRIGLNDAYWSTVFGGSLITTNGVNSALSSTDLYQIGLWWRWYVQESKGSAQPSEWALMEHPLEYQQIFKTFVERTRSRRFFLTESGRMGMGPDIIHCHDDEDYRRDVRVGDLICILYGSNLPVVLRPAEGNREGHHFATAEADSNSIVKCSLVRFCYVHGIMNGEALEDFPETDAATVATTRDFYIQGSRLPGPATPTDPQSRNPEMLPGSLQVLIEHLFGYRNETKKSRGKL